MKKFPVIWIAASALLIALAGCSGSPSPVSPNASIDSAPPSSPTGLAVTLDNGGARALSWTPNAEADLGSYQVYQYSPSPSRDNAYVLVATVGASTTQWKLPQVDTDVTTYFKLCAVDQTGNRSAQSTALAVQLLPSGLAPGEPTNDPLPRRH